MKSRSIRNVGFTVAVALALASLAVAAPKSDRTGKYLTIEGRVLQINKPERTLLVKDMWSKKLYLVHVPEGQGFRITFGMNARSASPEFRDVRQNDRVRMRCTRNRDHLARLADGREVLVLTAVE